MSRLFDTHSLEIILQQNGSSVSNTSRSGNPGYLPGAPIIAGNLNGNLIK